MNRQELLGLQIAATPVIPRIPTDKTLTERLQFAMRYVREHERDLFWMNDRTTDDQMFRTSLAAVMLAGSEQDQDVITRSMKPLQMLSAMLSGIQVDLEAMPADEDLLPLMKLWHESET